VVGLKLEGYLVLSFVLVLIRVPRPTAYALRPSVCAALVARRFRVAVVCLMAICVITFVRNQQCALSSELERCTATHCCCSSAYPWWVEKGVRNTVFARAALYMGGNCKDPRFQNSKWIQIVQRLSFFSERSLYAVARPSVCRL